MHACTAGATGEPRQRRQDGVLWLTIDREQRCNAMSPAVVAGLSEALRRASGDRSLRAIVVTGVGERAFCSGADLATFKPFEFDYSEPEHSLANPMRLARKPHVPRIARQRRLRRRRHGPACNVRPGCGGTPCALRPARGQDRRVAGAGAGRAARAGRPARADRAVHCRHFDRRGQGAGLRPGQRGGRRPRRRGTGPVGAHCRQLAGRHPPWPVPRAARRGHELRTEHGLHRRPEIGLFALAEDAAEGQFAMREKRKPEWSGR